MIFSLSNLFLTFKNYSIQTVTLAIVLSAFACSSQLKLPASTESSITVVKGDTVHQIHLLPQTSVVETLPARFYYYFSGGQLGQAEGAYLGKVLHGPYQQHTRNKQLLEQGVYDKGLKVGAWRQWYGAGHLASQIEYKKGLLHGNWLSYTPGGAIAWSRSYKKGLPHGKWINYYANSRPQMQEQWKEGIKEGDFQEYYPSGAIKKEGSYRKGLLHGKLREYSETGTVLQDRYRNGELKIKKQEPADLNTGGSEEEKSSFKQRFRLHKKKEATEKKPTEVPTIQQEQDQKNQKEQQRLRLWPFKTKGKKDHS